MADSPLLQAFDFQERWCREPAPFTARVLGRTRLWLQADDPARAVFDVVAADPLAAAVPLRWVGALHHLALRGQQPWAGLWPPASGALADAELDAAIDDAIAAAWREQAAHVSAALALPPQTNEVMRSAALLPGLLWLAERCGLPLVLLEIGASAGLNLWPDRYRHDHGLWSWGDPAAALRLSSDWQGSTPPHTGVDLRIARRAGCDAHPIDLGRPDEGLRLASFIWPEQADRLARLSLARAQAASWMAAEGVHVEALPAIEFVRRELARPAPGCAKVLMHSVVWQYIAPAEQADLRQAIKAAGAAATTAEPLAWLRLEPRAKDGHVELRCRVWPEGRDELLAHAHPHGARIEWVAAAPGPTVGA